MGGWKSADASGFAPGALVPLSTEEAASDLFDFVGRDDTRFGLGWSIDDTCGQVGTGEMALMWARSGAGKSTWMLNVIRNTPTVPTVVFNMEMTPRRQLEWLAAMTFDMTVSAREIEDVLREGPDDARYHETREAVAAMGHRYPDLHFVNPTRPDVTDLAIVLDDIDGVSGVRPRRVFVDHLTLMAGADDYRGVSRTASELHDFAMKNDVALYVCQQTGRGGGDDGRNDGHLPVTMSSGLYAGEQDADWLFGLYRPDKNPKYKKRREQFKDYQDYLDVRMELEKVRGLVIQQVIKNRPFGETLESGIEFMYDRHTRRYQEVGEY